MNPDNLIAFIKEMIAEPDNMYAPIEAQNVLEAYRKQLEDHVKSCRCDCTQSMHEKYGMICWACDEAHRILDEVLP